MKNQFSVPKEKKEKKQKKRKPNKFFKGLLALINGEALTKDGVVKNLPFVMFLAVVLIGYIGWGYWGDETLRTNRELELENEELRSEFITLDRELNLSSRQSQIADSVVVMGLKESSGKIKKITVSDNK